LAEDLLVVAGFDQGRLPIGREPVPLRALLERVRDRFEPRAADQGREIAVSACDDVVDLDPFRLEQALANLVDNALRHGGGDISLRGRCDGGEAVLEVSDEGEGFAADFEGEAFERFTRADAARGGNGSGLGLAIVRAIAAAHRGRAAIVRGPDGIATTLQIRLPIEAAAALIAAR
jgi:two-component system, OmpR family, sensor kinase